MRKLLVSLFAVVAGAAVFATPVATSELSVRAYVQRDLIAQWDAIENAGFGLHDDAPAAWKDLREGGYDIALPASGVTITANNLQLAATTMTNTVPEFLTATAFQGEAYAAADDDYVSANTRREVFYNYKVALFFRNASSGLIGGAFLKPNNQNEHWYAPGKPAVEYIQSPHTYSVASSSAGSTYSSDGSVPAAVTRYETVWPANIYGANGVLHLGSTEVTLNYGALRFYQRQLSDAEIAWNAMIDRHRFAGAALDPTITLDDIRIVDGKVQYACKASADATGFGSVSIKIGNASGTVGAYNWYEAGKKTQVTFTATPNAGKAFVRWEGVTDLGQDKLLSPSFTVEDVPVALTAVFRSPSTKTWVGTNTSAKVAGNWSPDGAPETGDAIVLNGNCNQAMTWDIEDVKPGSWTQDGYTGTVTIPVGTPGLKFWNYNCPVYGSEYDGDLTRFEVLGDVTIKSGKWKSAAHPANGSPNLPAACASGMGAYRLYIKVGGKFTLAAGASVDADSCGFCAYIGPGASSSGSAYGGSGQNGPTVPITYGSVYRPVQVGSGGGGTALFAGGAVRIEAEGAVTIDGTVSADETDGGAGTSP